MMKTIYKYELPLTDTPVIQMPNGAKVLSAGEQMGKLFVWAHVNPDVDLVPHQFRVAGTGHRMEQLLEGFIGTVLMVNGLVWHVFYLGEEKR